MLSLLAVPEACPDWYVLHVATGREARIASLLARREVEHYLASYTAKRRLSHRREEEIARALFPGYIFARFENRAKRVAAVSTPGVFGLLQTPVTDPELQRIREMATSGMCLPVSPGPWRKGLPVEIIRGPLRGYCGTVVREKNKHRVIVEFPILGRAVDTEVQPQDLRSLQIA